LPQCDTFAAERQNVRIHSPLGSASDLARHLILWVPTVPAL
jgi:hypothetical protein